MHLNEYQEQARASAIYPDSAALFYPALKLAGEAGEVAEKIGKHLRGDYDYATMKRHVHKELGDVLWYVANIAEDLELSLELIALENLAKLASRKARGVLQGDGDDR